MASTPRKLYQVVYTSADAYALGVGFAAWRDVGVFFKTARADDTGTPNPVAGLVTHSIGRGVSQSGNFLRGWLHLGFNRDENGKQVHDGLWPIIAGRRIALNFRWAQPDGVLELYQAGSEGPQWWLPNADPVRGGPTAGLLDRCHATNTCPKIIEHFGSAEVWALKLTPEWIGTDARADLPLPRERASLLHREFESRRRRRRLRHQHARRRAADHRSELPRQQLRHRRAGRQSGPAHRDRERAARALPRLGDEERRTAAKAAGRSSPTARWRRANKSALGFPTIPQLRPTMPRWTSSCRCSTTIGVRTSTRSTARASRRTRRRRSAGPADVRAARSNDDGNELGGVPVALLDAPLGTYLGWNITAGGARPFHQGEICNYVGGMVPFAKTAAERKANGDPRLSLEERYRDHDGYVEAVRKATERAVKAQFLLEADAQRLVKEAGESKVLR